MKGFLAFAILAAAVCIGQGKVEKEYAAKMKAAGLKCKEEHKMDDASYTEMINYKKTPETEEGKCTIACYLKEMGYFHDGAFDHQVIQEANKHKWEDPATVEKANGIAKTCIDEAGTGNECEMGYKIMSCLIREGQAQGVPAPEVD